MRQMAFTSDILREAVKWASIEFNRLVTVEQVTSPGKHKPNLGPRWFCMAYMHAIGTKSLPQVGRAFNRDHTTVLHALRRAHGYDGKWKKGTTRKEPLWTKEHFVNLVTRDGFIEPESVTLEHIERVGSDNLARFVSGEGWAA